MDITDQQLGSIGAPLSLSSNAQVSSNLVPSSSPGFSTPVHPTRITKPSELVKPSILPILLSPGIVRPLAFRTITKRHNLTLNASALQLFATFIGKHCGSGWREEGLAEKVLDEAAKSWKKNGGGVLLSGEGEQLKSILCRIEGSTTGGIVSRQIGLDRSSSLGDEILDGDVTTMKASINGLCREESQSSLGMSSLDLGDDGNKSEARDPRQWMQIVGAFDQPRLIYNVHHKHFEPFNTNPSFMANPSHKTYLFRQRYDLVHQRLLRNESFQSSSVAVARASPLQRASATTATIQQAYKLTPIANLLGRSGSTHLLLGLLSISPTGALTLNDPTGSISLDLLHARPVPEDGAWFAPGMIVLVDGVYEEEGSSAEPGLDSNCGVGGTVGGKFLAFSIGGPPCERREVTIGISTSSKEKTSHAAGAFGWVDFLGVGSERASGPAMRRLEKAVLEQGAIEAALGGRDRIIILGEVQLDDARTFQALRKVLALYATDKAEQTPMTFILMGNFVRYAVMAGGASGGSIEYKEYFDTLASALSDYPTMLRATTFVFVPSDNDPWASAFSAGAAAVLPRTAVPEIFTSRVRRAFSVTNVDSEKRAGKKTDGEPIWSTNPTRLTLFGPAQEIVLFRDDLLGRLRRNAITFRSPENETDDGVMLIPSGNLNDEHKSAGQDQARIQGMPIDSAVQTAESKIPLPVPKVKESSSSTVSSDMATARKLVKTILDQGYLSPFPMSDRPVLWDYSGALQLYPLPTGLVLMDPEAPPFAVTYEGCHVMNPGPLNPPGKRGIAQWMEYNARTRRGRMREVRY